MSPVAKLEVIESGSRRRWTLAEKQRIVAEAESGPRLVSATARRYGISSSQLFSWRRAARAGKLGADETMRFVPAMIAAPLVPSRSAVPGQIEIMLAQGHRLMVDSNVDAAALARVLAVLTGR